MEKDKKKEKEDKEKLKELRNNVCGGMALINMLWVAINFMFQYKKPTVISIPLSVSSLIVLNLNPKRVGNLWGSCYK